MSHEHDSNHWLRDCSTACSDYIQNSTFLALGEFNNDERTPKSQKHRSRFSTFHHLSSIPPYTYFCLRPYEAQLYMAYINTLRPRQHGRHFADDYFKRIFWNENIGMSIKISPEFVYKGPINNNPALVQIMAWRRSGDKPLSEPVMVCLLTHICVTRPQWVNDT